MLKKTLTAILLLTGLSLPQAFGQDEIKPEHKVLKYFADHAKPPMVKAAFMGVTAERVSPAMNSQLNLPQGLGLVVTHVVPDGPAAEAGLKKHDVLHKLDDQLLVNFEQFAVLVRLHEAGETVALSVIRGGEPTTIDVTLTEREVPELPMGQPAPPALWFGHDKTGPFGASGFVMPQIDTKQIQARALAGMQQGWPINPEEHVVHAKDRYKLRIVDGEHKILIDKFSGDIAEVTVTDADGNTTFQGKWEPGSDETTELPAEVVEKIHEVLTAPQLGEPIRIHADEIEITPAPTMPELEREEP